MASNGVKINQKSDYLVILLPTYNRLESLKKAVDSVLKNTKCSHELIVIDGGSTDGTIEYLKQRNDITSVFQNKLLGPTRACNEVWKNIECKYTAPFADDEECLPGAFDLGVNILEKNPNIGMVGLKIRDLAGPKKTWQYTASALDTGVVSICQGIFSMKILRAVGFYDEKYLKYRADADLTSAVLCTGKKVVMTREITMLHHRKWAEDEQELIKEKERDSKIIGKKLLYHKFKFLGSVRNPIHKIKERVLRFLNEHVYSKRNSELPIFGLIKKDWEILAQSRFINIFDEIFNNKKPFYLIQKMPKKILLKKENPYRHLVGMV